ncbi:uncharacterized protein B0H18DRAFT_1119494 [Fomitopsis serialis]|uniref:uncharacterized protein n=1 Tax=Fomitopsis serialis TaxID=139415 RepID=UPI00200739F8|nr:uncharacterized protein B0H18DRAFT_1119494 [Neoantrodia serialis]KAH9925296.1 hypothetical protein B0H18DRAFT_1119494 [Neoantrodia serialis]
MSDPPVSPRHEPSDNYMYDQPTWSDLDEGRIPDVYRGLSPPREPRIASLMSTFRTAKLYRHGGPLDSQLPASDLDDEDEGVTQAAGVDNTGDANNELAGYSQEEANERPVVLDAETTVEDQKSAEDTIKELRAQLRRAENEAYEFCGRWTYARARIYQLENFIPAAQLAKLGRPHPILAFAAGERERRDERVVVVEGHGPGEDDVLPVVAGVKRKFGSL